MNNINVNQKQTIETVKGSLGIFTDCGEDLKSLEELLNILAEENCVTIESSKPFSVYKNYNSFSWYTYNTKESKNKFEMITESEQILVFKESFNNDEYDEDVESTSPVFELSVESIDEYEYDPLNQILTLYLDNDMSIRLYYV